MTETEEFMLEALLNAQSFAPEVSEEAQTRITKQFVTAAAYFKPTLHIVTLDCSDQHNFRVNKRKSSHFDLKGDSSLELRQFARMVVRFLKQHNITTLYLRVFKGRKEYAPHFNSQRSRTVLQLYSAIVIHEINPISVTAWQQREDPNIPEDCDLRNGKQWLNGRNMAIRAAAYAATTIAHRCPSKNSGVRNV